MPAQNTLGPYRWLICLLLFFATAINYIDRQILSLIKPILDDEIGWTSTQFGAVNSAFQAAYAVSLFFFGWFIDKYGTKIGYSVSIAAWSLAAIGHTLVNSIGGFFVARVALGLGEGGNFPAAVKAVAQWFPSHERALATSLFNSGSNVGAIIAPAIVPLIAYSLGWHYAFIIAGGAGFVWLVLWWVFFTAPNESAASAQKAESADEAPPNKSKLGAVSWSRVLRHKQAWSFITAKFLTDPIWWFFLIWLPDFFKRTRDLDIKSSWVLLMAIYMIITVLSIAGGWVTGYLASRGWSITRARKTGLLVFALCVVPIAGISWVSDWMAVLLIGLAGAAHQAWSATLYTTVSDMFPQDAIAKLVGIGGSAGSIGGIAFPLITGIVLDQFTDGYTIIFIVCAAAYLLAFAVNHLLAPRFTRVEI